MQKSKLILYSQDDIDSQEEFFRHNNAFILPDGTFYLAKGYIYSNPSHQLESSSLDVIRKEVGFNIPKAECEEYFQKRDINYKKRVNERGVLLYYLRSILVHYYGYALFARKEGLSYWDKRNVYIDHSMVPNPIYFGKDVTQSQVETLERLFELNDDGSWCHDLKNDTQVYLKKILSHRKDIWHYEL